MNKIQLGIKDTLEVLEFGFATQRAISEALADKKINIFDAPLALKPLLTASAAFEGFENVKAELLNLDDNDINQLRDFVQSRFDIADDKVEALVEETIDEVIGDIKIALKWASSRRK